MCISCTPQMGNNAGIDTPLPTQTREAYATPTIELSATPIPPTPTPDLIDLICSPLEGETLKSISEIIQNPFIMPRKGFDDGHVGVDFSYYRRNTRVGIEGLQIFSAMDGKVVSVINDKVPYGNAIIIETPLEELNLELMSQIQIPELQPTVLPNPEVMVFCSQGELSFPVDSENRSLYLLYGHLQNPASLSTGDKVTCGQHIGNVGNTGNSSNPHLHFETRVGPSGASFDSMAYYTVQSTVSERYNYCVWRVSNMFQLFDPMLLLSAQEQ